MIERKTKFTIVTGFVALFLVWVAIAPLLASWLITENSVEKSDAILVLSGSSAYEQRTRKAAKLYREGVSSKILLTDDGGYGGWSQSEQRNPPFVYLAEKELVDQGVKKEHIEVLLPQVTGTIYEARNLKTKLGVEDWESVLLVTSPYHTRRALWTFKREVDGDDVEIRIVATSQMAPNPPILSWWLTPKGWQVVGGEYVKFVVYSLFY